MFELRSTVSLVAGLFQSISIIAAVLACAFWDFMSHTAEANLYYSAALICGFILNTGICLAMARGLATLQSKYFFPYVVCAGFHFAISIALTFTFVLCGLIALVNGEALLIYLVGTATMGALTAFWLWSLLIVQEYRNFVREVSGEHVLFHNVDFV